MPTFVFDSALPPTWGVFLLPVPSVQWFNDSVLQALAEMTEPTNWRGDDLTELNTAVRYASEMLSRYQLLNFNPFPPGMIFPWGATIAPAGYLMCDGSSYVFSDYPELFAQIGYYWGGSGDNFNVPSLINRVPVGAGGDFTMGDVGGEETHTLTVTEMPSHTHADLGHSHGIPFVTSFATQEGVGVGRLLNVPLVPNSTDIGFANNQNTGGDGAHNNMQPYIAMHYIIYAGR
jgi:microcystin-dependent protein